MSYEPTNWKTGDVVTSAKLNKLENGVANSAMGILKVNIDVADKSNISIYALDKTWKEINDVYYAGGMVCYIDVDQSGDDVRMTRIPISRIEYNETDPSYSVYLEIFGDVQCFITDTETGYPTYIKNKPI